ncbi:putative maleylacetoacetate isomerase [Candidatus Methylobacter favarea]|uniref:Putative maleylacetoacetate isomerase n=1 Tax=Candidatus Methylobacter favarea TaxID=2707345 RepID=A0A8S0X3D6_9GAMM|nr:maleylacetoacetate isomerase [Candidatus Methylobacter favarea]CAA9892654.1 putative maleylacetoacetate isomerase [Candidatus Methylobacter favarea]
MPIVLYSYFRSSAAYRVRIALNLKNIDYEIRPVHLLKHGGEQFKADFLALNPQGRVPVLVVQNTVLTQSSAIIEYLEEAHPSPPLLPADAMDRAWVRSLAQLIACDIHPLNNLRVLNYLKDSLNHDHKEAWYRHWIQEGFTALEQLLQNSAYSGQYCFGATPGLADAFLIPQVYNALRFNCDMNNFPLINDIYQHCLQETAFLNAAPEHQPDAEP